MTDGWGHDLYGAGAYMLAPEFSEKVNHRQSRRTSLKLESKPQGSLSSDEWPVQQ